MNGNVGRWFKVRTPEQFGSASHEYVVGLVACIPTTCNSRFPILYGSLYILLSIEPNCT